MKLVFGATVCGERPRLPRRDDGMCGEDLFCQHIAADRYILARIAHADPALRYEGEWLDDGGDCAGLLPATFDPVAAGRSGLFGTDAGGAGAHAVFVAGDEITLRLCGRGGAPSEDFEPDLDFAAPVPAPRDVAFVFGDKLAEAEKFAEFLRRSGRDPGARVVPDFVASDFAGGEPSRDRAAVKAVVDELDGPLHDFYLRREDDQRRISRLCVGMFDAPVEAPTGAEGEVAVVGRAAFVTAAEILDGFRSILQSTAVITPADGLLRVGPATVPLLGRRGVLNRSVEDAVEEGENIHFILNTRGVSTTIKILF